MGARAMGLRESVYVAASSREATRAAAVGASLKAAGYRLIFPWWFEDVAPSDDLLPRYARKSLRDRCLYAAANCDRFVLLVPPAGVVTVGACVELGASLLRRHGGDVGQWLAVAGPRPATLFLHDALWFESDRDLVAALSDDDGDVVVRAAEVL